MDSRSSRRDCDFPRWLWTLMYRAVPVIVFKSMKGKCLPVSGFLFQRDFSFKIHQEVLWYVELTVTWNTLLVRNRLDELYWLLSYFSVPIENFLVLHPDKLNLDYELFRCDQVIGIQSWAQFSMKICIRRVRISLQDSDLEAKWK